MKKVFLFKVPFLCIIISTCIGFFVGIDIEQDFLNLYTGKLTTLPFRYIMLVLIVFISNSIFSMFSNTIIIVRKRNFFNVFVNIIKYEVLFFALLYIFVNIPIFALNNRLFIENLGYVMLVILNSILISILFSGIIEFIDIKFKNRVYSTCSFFIVFSIIDFVLEHFNFYILIDNQFDLSYIFVLPVVFRNYIVIAAFMLFFICIITYTNINYSNKKDYFLRDEIK